MELPPPPWYVTYIWLGIILVVGVAALVKIKMGKRRD